MNNYYKIYWLTRLDSIQGLFVGCMVLSIIAIIAYFIAGIEVWGEDGKKEYEWKYGIYKNASIVLIFISGILLTFIPSKNEAILIYAGGKTLDFVQQDTSLAKIPNQATVIISEYLDKSIKELKEGK